MPSHPPTAAQLPRALALTLLLLPALARANMALPSFRSSVPLSSALRPAGAGLTVRAETLTFELDEPGAAVAAEYLVDAAAGADLSLTFISPQGSSGIRAWVNGEERPVTTAPLEGTGGTGAEEDGRRSLFRELLQGRFTGRLEAGENRIRVAYTQGFGLFWIPTGYFQSPAYLRVFPYELWPLKGWTLDPGFHLDLRVTVQLPRAGLWTRTFGTVPAWRLYANGSPRSVDPVEYFRGTWRRGVVADPPESGAGDAHVVPPERDPDAWQFMPVAESVEGKLLGGSLLLTGRIGPRLPDRLYIVLDKRLDRGEE